VQSVVLYKKLVCSFVFIIRYMFCSYVELFGDKIRIRNCTETYDEDKLRKLFKRATRWRFKWT